MAGARGLLVELKRRNVVRAGLLYIGAMWALAQGISQLSPAVSLPEWGTRWFLIASAIGFPFWLAFAWFYEWTLQGLKRESEVAAGASITRPTGRRLDRAIIAVLAVAVVLLLTNTFALRKGAGLGGGGASAVADKSVAVLPLANDSGDKDQQYFSDGLSEDLINALSQFAGLKVISRNSSFQFRDSRDDSRTIGAKLGCARCLRADVRLKQLIDQYADSGAFQIAQLYAWRKQPDKMFEWLDRALAVHDPGAPTSRYAAFVMDYSADPRFVAFCNKIGLPATADAKALP